MNINKSALILEIYGTVQGVGFRPYVFILAKKYQLNGFVANTSYGVEILVEGMLDNINKFISDIKKNTTQIISVSHIKKIKKTLSNYTDFTIKQSSKKSQIVSDFPSDIAICDNCKKELLSCNDRRYHYPFTNCTQCGPRYSIVKKLPYDRENTTMKTFKMCFDCGKEYNQIENRRFHAQPNACHMCGPKVELYINSKPLSSSKLALSKTAQMLDAGKIIAIKSIGGYHLACDAYNEKAVLKLRKIKSREKKPFAIMVKNISIAKALTHISSYEKKELLSPVSPIVLLNKKDDINKNFNDIIAKNNRYLGVMLPYTPIHYILFDLLKTNTLIMTSANKNDEPIIYTETDIFKEFSSKIDGILTNNREIYNPVDDSIVLCINKINKKIVLRRSRGYVPNVVNTNVKENILAIGADIKNSFCITRKKAAYLSAYCGDMFNYNNLSFLDKSIRKYMKFLDVIPKNIVYDLHPQYNTSNYVKEKFRNKSLILNPVQHHYAHVASVIAEHNVKGDVIGFAYDGTGFGYDSKIWGSECLLFTEKNISRLAHFEYFNLVGGDIAIKEIWRISLSIMHKYNRVKNIPKHIKQEKFYKNVLSLLQNKNNDIQTCSVGRFLDAITSLIGLTNYVEYEGQGAIHLESILKNKTYKPYKFDLEFNEDKSAIIKLNKIIEGVIKDLKNKIDVSVISGKIHETICQLICYQAKIYSKIYKTDKIALSGGVFQNKYILSRSINLLEKSQFKVYFNSLVPVNDGGISLGQSYICSNYKKLFV
ncbi:MAG: carbamoyltransferase HypF [Endomicrobiaceae bacterium]|nr:carbamoyltransferase HypF [Endomicrobiaceae bacterium]